MILPYMKKRIVKVSSEDLQELLVKRQIPTSEISDALKAALPKGKHVYTCNLFP